MKLLRRFKYYGIGFGIGLIISIILFQGRGCEWLPSNRVKAGIIRSDIMVSDSISCLINCLKMDSTNFYKWIGNADVNFGKSETKKMPRIYRLEAENLKMEFSWFNEGDTTILESIITDKQCDCKDNSDLKNTIDWSKM